jgi:MoaD family protein
VCAPRVHCDEHPAERLPPPVGEQQVPETSEPQVNEMVVRFFAGVREITKVDQLRLSEAPADVASLAEVLVTRYGKPLQGAIMSDEVLSQALVVLVNGHNIRLSGGAATPLQQDDEVAIFPMVSGG